MNLDLKRLFIPLIAVGILAIISLQTSEALKNSGAWRKAPAEGNGRPDPYAALDAEIAERSKAVELVSLRDPFAFGRAPEPATPHIRTTTPPAPPPPRRPVLTAILQGDDDPRALLHYNDRDYTVKAGDLFADFQVISIAGDQVVLARGSERMILRRPTKGD